ncbi:sensor histidine kinase [Anaerosporobacter faecicola]|uniref:sensor histidine kinase n=1 Tax=Anaerosporobacter faecicola TaxID=2718714 RepID=UPI00143B5E68|nr:HAMP domain-containing sensor histidine kinase [Anaerosporobacter faecicola]
MKRYDKLFIWVVVVWLLITIGGVIVLQGGHEKKQGKPYQIVINRLLEQVKTKEDIEELDSWIVDAESTPYIQQVAVQKENTKQKEDVEQLETFLDASTGNQETEYLTRFVQLNDGQGYFIRFEVKQVESSSNGTIYYYWFFLSGAVLLLIVWLLVHVKKEILQPFQMIKNMPYDLARGHLKQEMKENKNRYFGKFLWGINMLRETMEDHKKKEMELEKEKKTMVASLSHDIKTPLSMITLYTQALKEGLYDTKEKQNEALEQILEKTMVIQNYVSEIVHVSRNQLCSRTVREESFLLEEVIASIRSSYVERCKRYYIDLTIQEVPSCMVLGDKDCLIEVVENVLENAIKYGDKGSITISFFEEEYCQIIQITNSGIPVPNTEFVHMFESFWRGNNAHEKQGYGLGLYICKNLMQQMKGEIYAENTPDSMSFMIVVREA